MPFHELALGALIFPDANPDRAIQFGRVTRRGLDGTVYPTLMSQ